MLVAAPGYSKTIKIPILYSKPKEYKSRYIELIANARFRTERIGFDWNAYDVSVHWGKQSLHGRSLRGLLAQQLEQGDSNVDELKEKRKNQLITQNVKLKPQRSIAQVTQLPDRAVLDDVQDPIFRHEIDGTILITGAPGTGKTTVQIKRLAQKTKWSYLTDSERSGLDQSTWNDNEGWVFFTPTPLLKNYLKEALSKEQLAASDDNVKVWNDYKLHLLRRIRFMRVKDTDPTFRRAPKGITYLRQSDSQFITNYGLKFYKWMENEVNTSVCRTLSIDENTPFPLSRLSRRKSELPKAARKELGYARLFRKIPALYNDFRKQEAKQNRALFKSDESVDEAFKQMKIDSQEMSVILYCALRWVRSTWSYFEGDTVEVTGGPAYLIQDEKMIVSIDEASDFSAIEIGAMSLLSSPKKSSVSLSGDLMQRLSTEGMQSWNELEMLDIHAKQYTLRRAYRQTDRLSKIAAKLYQTYSGDQNAPTDSINSADNDPPVLIKATPTDREAAEWISSRVREIYELSGSRLPSIGVLVSNENEVDSFAKLLLEELYDAAIDVDASPNGKNLGDKNKVRVFCVDHIKGLEFESVFFCNIDKMAEHQTDLIDKLVYVGLSRSRSFLGMTYKDALPKRLDVIAEELSTKERFSKEDAIRPWRSYLDIEDVSSISQSSQELLDIHFPFYWDCINGKAKTENPRQEAFLQFIQAVKNEEDPAPSDEHDTAIKAFIDLQYEQEDIFH